MSDADRVIGLAIGLIEHFEGLRLRPYLCPAGVPTIGLGSTRYLDGRPVTMRDPPITREHAYILARHELMADCLPAVMRLCPTLRSPEAVAAIADWTYNLGQTNLRGSTMRKRILAGDWDGAWDECMRWVRGGGKVLPGLVMRRATEASML